MEWLESNLSKENCLKLISLEVTTDAILFNLLEDEVEENIIPLLSTIGCKSELRRRWRNAQKSILGLLNLNMIEKVAYGQFEYRKGFKTSHEWTIIPMEHSRLTKNIELNETYGSLIFKYGGVYKLSVGFRPGSGGDVWMGIRLRGYKSKQVVGISNLSGQHCYVFLVTIDDLNDHYVVQIGRNNANVMTTLPQKSPWDNVVTASFVTVVEFLGSKQGIFQQQMLYIKMLSFFKIDHSTV